MSAVQQKQIEIEYDFQGGITLATSGVKNGLIAAIDLGMLMLVREAMQRLIDDMMD